MSKKQDKIKDTILRSTENSVASVADDNVKANMEVETGAGMEPKILRSSDGKCCAWCSSLVGEYYEDEAPDDIYARHDNCNCTVTYISEKGYQDAHTKKWIDQQELDVRRERVIASNNNISSNGYMRKKRIEYDKEYNLEQHKRGVTVPITEQAIDKVKRVRPSGLSENQTDMLKKMNRDILDYAMKNNESNEVAMLMHEGVKVSKPIKGDYRSVDIMADADGYHILISSNYRSVTLSHNHPGLSYFSSDDLFIFMKYPSIKSMAVVTNRGKVWYINKKDSYDDEEVIDAFFEFGRRHKDWDDRRIVRVFLREYSSMIERN